MKPTTVSVRVTNWVPPPGCHLPELKLHCSKSVYAANCSCIGGPSGPSALIQTCWTFFPNLRGSNTPYCWSDAGPVIKIRAGPQACSPQLSSLWMLLQRYAGSDCRDDGTSEVLFLFPPAASHHILTLAFLTIASITHQNLSNGRHGSARKPSESD